MKFLLILLTHSIISISSFGQEKQKISVYFDVDSHTLNSDALHKLAELLHPSSSEVTITKVESFTDQSASNSYNKLLAQRRSNAVTLILKHIDGQPEISIIGEEYQTSNYIADEFRRVDIYFESVANEIETERANNGSIESITTGHRPSILIEKFSEFIQDSTVKDATIILSVLFVGGQDIFLNPQDPDLWKLFDIMRHNENIRVEIRGHVCCGSNNRLSIMRAYAVYKFLTDRSIYPDRIKYNGYNNTIPAVSPELTEHDRKMNRRVDVVFHKTAE